MTTEEKSTNKKGTSIHIFFIVLGVIVIAYAGYLFGQWIRHM